MTTSNPPTPSCCGAPVDASQDEERVHTLVRDAYTHVAQERDAKHAAEVARRIGYDEAELAAAPEGANLGLGCGNPGAIAALRPGEVVVDLGSGAGFDALLAARAVGPAGRVIGVDMTDAMLARARENARRAGLDHVEFRKGVIEELPLPDASVDVVISNCVINLAADKRRVFREAFRVLKPGGRLVVSDLVLEKPLPEPILKSAEAYVGCIAGALLRDDYLAAVRDAGFHDVEVVAATSYAGVVELQTPEIRAAVERLGLTEEEVADAAASVTSLKLSARR